MINEIRNILKQNSSHNLDKPVPAESEISKVEELLGMKLPEEYKIFVRLGGLNDLLFSCEIAKPEELIAAKAYIQDKGCMPFASNDYGDLFCWEIVNDKIWPVIFWNHETNKFNYSCDSFISWLKENRI